MSSIYTVIPKNAPLKALSTDAGTPARFRKQLIRFGDWMDPLFPGDVMCIDGAVMDAFVRNFDNKVVGRVSVPLGHPITSAELVEMNKGELMELSIEGDGTSDTDGLYGVLEIRDQQTVDDINADTLWDVSISFTDDYVNNETGMHCGPTIVHVGLVNDPYIKKMQPFTALAATIKKALSGKWGAVGVRMLSEQVNKETTMSKVKNDRAFPVEVVYTKDGEEVTVTLEVGQEVEVAEDQLDAVQTLISEAVAPDAVETEEEKTAREAKEAADQAAADKAAQDEAERQAEAEKNLSEGDRLRRDLAAANAKLRKQEVDKLYDTNLRAGKIVPAQKAAFVSLAEALHGQTRQLSDGVTVNLSEVLADFIAKSPRIVNLDDEQGKIEDDSQKSEFDKLPEDSKQGLQKFGVSAEDYNTLGTRENISIAELAK